MFPTSLPCADRPLDNPAASSGLSEQESVACLTVLISHQQ